MTDVYKIPFRDLDDGDKLLTVFKWIVYPTVGIVVVTVLMILFVMVALFVALVVLTIFG